MAETKQPPPSTFLPLRRCDFDAAGSQLQWLYSNTLTPPTQGQRDAITADAEAAAPAMAAACTAGTAGHSWAVGAGVMSSFDQSIFVNASAPMGTGVGPTGYIYVPAGCNATAGGTASCRLHISWHGCNQGASAIGETFVLNGGYLPWADANNIVVLFPQAATTLGNPGKFAMKACDCWARRQCMAAVSQRFIHGGFHLSPQFPTCRGLLGLVGLYHEQLRHQDWRAAQCRVQYGCFLCRSVKPRSVSIFVCLEFNGIIYDVIACLATGNDTA